MLFRCDYCLLAGGEARTAESRSDRHHGHECWCHFANHILQHRPNDRWTDRGRHWKWNQHCHCARLADRDIGHQVERKACGDRVDPEYRGLLSIKLGDIRIFFCWWSSGMAVSVGVQFIFIIVLYATVPWLPESPRWLIAHEYEDEAFKILADLENRSENDPFILTQHKEIVYTVQYERENAVKWADLLRGRTGEKGGTKTMRRLILGAGTQAMQQLSGINVTSYYLPTVLIQSVGLDEKMARLLAACNSVSYLLFSLIGIPNVERWGRRNMMIFASSGQAFCYLLITILIRYNEKPGYAHAHEVASASVAFFFLYYVFFGIGMQGVPWLYPTEINSLAMRTKGAAIGTATNWIFNFMVVEITPIGIQNLHWKFYIVWTVLNASFIPLMYFFYPETAGRSLEDIDDYYRTNPPLLVFRDKDVTSSKRPDKYRIREEEEVRRNSSVDPTVFRRASRVSAGLASAQARQAQLAVARQHAQDDDYEGKTEAGDDDQGRVYYKEQV
ncbi:MFS transporter, SP family, sugar:H+ symporter [Exophiala dermatitidis NIH/UT8656]|uniref:MFS transporter, SP family, sugar:H+ symporter n=1 Tax=Exophiala dermatitidis (strain ATCC 34100 / CBS 525.76 / NIH/UT8656) TaxID=858893 RepID=H6C8Z6_EXODN|nr:MFS transporter, SP family, sugar:H+ symporter [Exophiala dermatitidis NIH/UT8656]EHY60573.1 MFS transporter, SP family, sugar:H+ symporter [Exophiala dermatitidis NIH/UT8656]